MDVHFALSTSFKLHAVFDWGWFNVSGAIQHNMCNPRTGSYIDGSMEIYETEAIGHVKARLFGSKACRDGAYPLYKFNASVPRVSVMSGFFEIVDVEGRVNAAQAGG